MGVFVLCWIMLRLGGYLLCVGIYWIVWMLNDFRFVVGVVVCKDFVLFLMYFYIVNGCIYGFNG